MTDVFTPEKRRSIMATVHGRNTSPEKRVRSMLHKLGYRFRLHATSLPGRPDIVLPRYRKVVFVHGCFWHQHPGCSRASTPTTNREFWLAKLQGNVARDLLVQQQLKEVGWQFMVVWECELRRPQDVEDRLRQFLNQDDV